MIARLCPPDFEYQSSVTQAEHMNFHGIKLRPLATSAGRRLITRAQTGTRIVAIAARGTWRCGIDMEEGGVTITYAMYYKTARRLKRFLHMLCLALKLR
jgi:hypothetical protein